MPSLKEWQVESVRATFFAADLSSGAWSSLWPVSEAVSLTERREQPAVKSLTEIGVYDRWQLNVQTKIDRVDIIIASHEFESSAPDFPSAGGFEEVSDAILRIIPKDFGRAISRVAFGAVMLLPVESHEAAYGKLSEYLPSIDISPDSRDFFYQINRPLDDDVYINRLSQWSAVKAKWIVNPMDPVMTAIEKFACRACLDISTSADDILGVGSIFPEDLFASMVRQAGDILRRGDV